MKVQMRRESRVNDFRESGALGDKETNLFPQDNRQRYLFF